MTRMQQFSVWAVSVCLGAMIGLEAHVGRRDVSANAYEAYLAAAAGLARQSAETKILQRELARTGAQWRALRAASTHAASGLRLLRAQARRLDAEAGLTPRAGNGIEITLAFDPRLPRIPGLQYVDEAEQLQMLVNWLQAGGAQAVAIGGQRLVTTSSIRTVGGLTASEGPFAGVVQVNQVPVAAPYVIRAIGPPAALADILVVEGLPGQFRILDQSFRLRRFAGAHRLRVPAYTGELPGAYAREAGF